MAWTHGVVALASVAAGALFVLVGLALRRRVPPSTESRDALVALSVWWLGMGLTTWSNAVLVWAGVQGNLQAALAARSAGLLAAGAAMWGIITYLAYVYTGRRSASAPAAWAYGALLAVTLAHIWWAGPSVLVVGDWTVDVLPEASSTGSVVAVVLTLAFLLPPVVAGPLFLRLLRRTRDAAQRRRILAVGAGVPLWVLLHLLARLSMADAWQFLTRVVVGVLVALLVAAAYATGPWPSGHPGGGEGSRREGLAQRVRDLV